VTNQERVKMAVTIDQEFIEYIVKTLVGVPDAVRVERTIDEKGVLLELYVDPGDLGRVIGRNGTTAKSIRTLLRALGVKNDARYNLKIVDTNGGGRRREDEGYSDNRDEDKSTPEEVAEEKSEEPIEVPATDENSNAEEDVATLGDDKDEEKSKKDKLREGLDEYTDLDI
jgi:uncharacterized protein